MSCSNNSEHISRRKSSMTQTSRCCSSSPVFSLSNVRRMSRGCICSSSSSRQLLFISSGRRLLLAGTKSGANKSRPFHYFQHSFSTPQSLPLFTMHSLTYPFWEGNWWEERLMGDESQLISFSPLPSTLWTFVLPKFKASFKIGIKLIDRNC